MSKDFYEDTYTQLYDADYRTADKCVGQGFIQELCQSYKFKTVLDVGCSTGLGVQRFQEAGKAAIGIDVAPQAITIAQRKGRYCYQGNAMNLLWPEKFFDLVFSSDVIEHLKPEDVLPAINQMQRVAKRYVAMQIATQLSKSGWKEKLDLPLPNLHLTVWDFSVWQEYLSRLRFWRLVSCVEWQKKKSTHVNALLERE